jgi:hypothetical protein
MPGLRRGRFLPIIAIANAVISAWSFARHEFLIGSLLLALAATVALDPNASSPSSAKRKARWFVAGLLTVFVAAFVRRVCWRYDAVDRVRARSRDFVYLRVAAFWRVPKPEHGPRPRSVKAGTTADASIGSNIRWLTVSAFRIGSEPSARVARRRSAAGPRPCAARLIHLHETCSDHLGRGRVLGTAGPEYAPMRRTALKSNTLPRARARGRIRAKRYRSSGAEPGSRCFAAPCR